MSPEIARLMLPLVIFAVVGEGTTEEAVIVEIITEAVAIMEEAAMTITEANTITLTET